MIPLSLMTDSIRQFLEAAVDDHTLPLSSVVFLLDQQRHLRIGPHEFYLLALH